MDLFQTFLNIFVPFSGICGLLLLWPLFTFLRIIGRVFRFFFEEKVRGKVVLITGASSGIGEQISYQYAKRGAVLVLVSQNEGRLRVVADRCAKKGAMDVRAIVADVSKEDDCRRFIEETVNHYGHMDHLVNNAGIAPCFFFEEVSDMAPLNNVMDVDFWGYVYPTFHALPHLKRTRGKIIVNASVAAWLPHPRMAIYNAVEAALVNFFDTLRVELGPNIGGITIVTPGWVESEMTMGKLLNYRGEFGVQEHQRDVHIGPVPVLYTEECAKAIIRGAVRKRRYVRFPSWYSVLLLYRIFAPEVLDFFFGLIFMVPMPGRKDKAPISKALIDIPGMKALLYTTPVRSPWSILKQVKP